MHGMCVACLFSSMTSRLITVLSKIFVILAGEGASGLTVVGRLLRFIFVRGMDGTTSHDQNPKISLGDEKANTHREHCICLFESF